MQSNNNLGDRLKIARKSANLTQAKASELLCIAYPTLNKYEKGHRTPDSQLLNQMAKLYGCDAGWILSGEEGGPCVVAERNEHYQALPEPIKKIVDYLETHPDKAWKYYALMLEEEEKKAGR